MSPIGKFPPPPADKTGWPWTEQSPLLTKNMSNGFTWPKISIVTPSLNQAEYLEETIRSVLLQNYPNLEYIIIDGGSTDGSVEIIKKYEPWLTYWVSEVDRGQSHAINKGFQYSTGEILTWINSDDYYALGTFDIVGTTFAHNDFLWVAGNCYIIQDNGEIKYHFGKPTVRMDQWLLHNRYVQPEIFWRRSIWNNVNGLDESMHYSFDYDLWLKFTQLQQYPYWIDQPFAYFRIHGKSKTGINRKPFDLEDRMVYQRYRKRLTIVEWYKIWKIRREKQAMFYLSASNFSYHPCIKILLGIFSAPWFLFTRGFYAQAKKILFQ